MFDHLSNYHAVITDAGVIINGQLIRHETAQFQNIEELLMLARSFQLEQLFILPGSKVFKRARRFRRRFVEDCGGWTVRPARLRNVLTCWKGDARVQVIFPGVEKRQWALDELTDGAQLFEAVSTLQKTLGVRIAEPIRTGKQLLTAGVRGRSIERCQKSLAIFRENKQHGIMYRRELTEAEKKAKYVHLFDKNKMFLSACDIHLGNGNYVNYQGNKFDKRLPGIWRVKMNATKDTPALALELLGGAHVKGWLYTPTLTIYERAKYKIHVEDARVWRDTLRSFEGFYKTLRNAFNFFSKGSVYEKCCKAIFTQFIGWLSPANPDLREGDTFDRPDWKHLIIAEANARLLANLLKLANETGITPAGIYVDELYFFSNEKDPAKALPHPFTGERAQYKHKQTWKARDVREVWKLETIKKIKKRLSE